MAAPGHAAVNRSPAQMARISMLDTQVCYQQAINRPASRTCCLRQSVQPTLMYARSQAQFVHGACKWCAAAALCSSRVACGHFYRFSPLLATC